MEAAGIHVIVGTPTYAVPAWLVRSHPEVLAETSTGQRRYGARQIMNITSPAYRLHAERVIRRLMEHTAHRPGVIGFQLDNETKYYDVASHDVQRAFVRHLRELFADDLDALNRAYGLDYWSNRVDAWEDFPDVRGTINGSLASAFDRFRRSLVEEFLGWQAAIVREYARDDQFLTHNFDFDWGPGWSYGLQPSVDHFRAARTVDIAGVDIYHPTQSRLTGKEIAFGGDMTRSIKGGANYLVLETQAQGQPGWLPYPGQLRLQALQPPRERRRRGHVLALALDPQLLRDLLARAAQPRSRGQPDLRRGRRRRRRARPRRAVAAAPAQGQPGRGHGQQRGAHGADGGSRIETGFPERMAPSIGYNDVLRWVYDALFELNLECDFVSPDTDGLDRYAMVVVPALYTAPESTLRRLRDFVDGGGYLVSTFKSFVADEHVKVWADRQPHGLTDVLGLTYNQFTRPGRRGAHPARRPGGLPGAAR